MNGRNFPTPMYMHIFLYERVYYFKGQYMNKSTFFEIKYMNGLVFFKGQVYDWGWFQNIGPETQIYSYTLNVLKNNRHRGVKFMKIQWQVCFEPMCPGHAFKGNCWFCEKHVLRVVLHKYPCRKTLVKRPTF